MGDNLDFSVDNYSLEELLEIFGIEGPIPQNEIIERGSKMIEKYRQAKKPEHVTFFSTATNKLLSNYQNIETFLNRVPESEEEDDSDSDEDDNESLDGKEGFVGGHSPKSNSGGNTNYVINVGGDKKHILPAENVWKNNLYNTQSTRNTMNSYMMPERTANVKVPVNLDHSVQLPKKLLLPNSYAQVPYLQGTMNPTLQNTYLTWINVDGQYRELVTNARYPTSCSFGATGAAWTASTTVLQKDTPTDFIFTLNNPITNVLSMTLSSLEVPLSGYNAFSAQNSNLSFDISFNWQAPGDLQIMTAVGWWLQDISGILQGLPIGLEPGLPQKFQVGDPKCAAGAGCDSSTSPLPPICASPTNKSRLWGTGPCPTGPQPWIPGPTFWGQHPPEHAQQTGATGYNNSGKISGNCCDNTYSSNTWNSSHYSWGYAPCYVAPDVCWQCLPFTGPPEGFSQANFIPPKCDTNEMTVKDLWTGPAGTNWCCSEGGGEWGCGQQFFANGTCSAAVCSGPSSPPCTDAGITGPCPCCYCWTPATHNSGHGPGGGAPQSTIPACLTRLFYYSGTTGPTHNDVNNHICGGDADGGDHHHPGYTSCCTCGGKGCSDCGGEGLIQIIDASGSVAHYKGTSVAVNTIIPYDGEQNEFICTQIPEGNYNNSIGTAKLNITDFLNASFLSILGPIPADPNGIIDKYAKILDTSGGDLDLYIKAFLNPGNSKISIALNGTFDWWVNLMEPFEVSKQTYRHGYRKTTRFHSSAFNVFGNAMPAAPYPYGYGVCGAAPSPGCATGPNYDWQSNNAFAIPRATYGWWDDRKQGGEGCCPTGPVGCTGFCSEWGHDFDPGELLGLPHASPATSCTGVCWLQGAGDAGTGCGYPLAVGAGYWQPGLSKRPKEWGPLPTGNEPPPPVQWTTTDRVTATPPASNSHPPYQQKRYGSGYPNLKALDINDPYRRQLIYPQNPASTCPFAPHGTNPDGIDYRRTGARGDAYKKVVKKRAEAEAWSPDIFGNFIYCWNEIVCNWGNTDVYHSFASSHWISGSVAIDLIPPVAPPKITFEQFLKNQPGYEDLILNGGFGTVPASAPLTDPHGATMGNPAMLSNNFDKRTLMGYWPGTCVPSCMLDRMLTTMQQNTIDYSGCKLIPNKGIWNPFEDTSVTHPYDKTTSNCIPDEKCGIPPFQFNQVQIYVLYYIHLILIPEAREIYATWLEKTMTHMGDLPNPTFMEITVNNTHRWLWLGGFMNMYTAATSKLVSNDWPMESHTQWPTEVLSKWPNIAATPVLPWPFPFTFNWDAYLPSILHGLPPLPPPPNPYTPEDVWAFAVSPGFKIGTPQFDIQWYNPDGDFFCIPPKCTPFPGSATNTGGEQANNPGRRLNRNLGWYLGFKTNISSPTIQSLETQSKSGLYDTDFVKFALLNTGTLDLSGVVQGAPPWIYYTLTGCLKAPQIARMENMRFFAFQQHALYINKYNGLFHHVTGIGPIEHAFAFMHPPYSKDFAAAVKFVATDLYLNPNRNLTVAIKELYNWYIGVDYGSYVSLKSPAAVKFSETSEHVIESCSLLWYGMQAKCIANMNGTNYMTLIIDDFIQNRFSGNMAAFSTPFTTFKTPSYAQRFESSQPVCKNKNGKITFRDGRDGPTIIARKCRQGTPNPNDIIDGSNNLTQAQKWTAKQIANEQQQPSLNQVVSPTLTNVLMRVPVNREQISQGGLLVVTPQYSTASGGRGIGRRYYGPVTLKRLHIQLVDDTGNPLNLNCGNISFSLLLERLYQY